MDVDILLKLQELGEEFESSSTKNDRRREIETVLWNYHNSLTEPWRFYLGLLSPTSPVVSAFVQNFALTMLQRLVRQKYRLLEAGHRQEIRSALWLLLLQSVTTQQPCSTLLFRRLVHLNCLVTLIESDAATNDRTFLQSVLQLCSNSDSQQQLTGYSLLHCLGDELNDVNAAVFYGTNRLSNFKGVGELAAPHIAQLLVEILQDEKRRVVTANTAISAVSNFISFLPLHILLTDQLVTLLMADQAGLSLLLEIFGRQRRTPVESIAICRLFSIFLTRIVSPALEQPFSHAVQGGIVKCYSGFVSTSLSYALTSKSKDLALDEFVLLLHRLTMVQKFDSELFLRYLEIWTVFLETIVSTNFEQELKSFLLNNVAHDMLGKSLFATNAEDLMSVRRRQQQNDIAEDEGENGDLDADSQNVLKVDEIDYDDICFELVCDSIGALFRKIAQVYPSEMLNLLFQAVKQRVDAFLLEGDLASDTSYIDVGTLISYMANCSDLLSPSNLSSVFTSLSDLTIHCCRLGASSFSGNQLLCRLFEANRAIFLQCYRSNTAVIMPATSQLAEAAFLLISSNLDSISPRYVCVRPAVDFLYVCLTSRQQEVSSIETFEKVRVIYLDKPSMVPTKLALGIFGWALLPFDGISVDAQQQNWSARSSAVALFTMRTIVPFIDDLRALRLIDHLCKLVASESPRSRQLFVSSCLLAPLSATNETLGATVLSRVISMLPAMALHRQVHFREILNLFASLADLQSSLVGDAVSQLLNKLFEAFPPSSIVSVLNTSSENPLKLVAAFLSTACHFFAKGDAIAGGQSRKFLPSAIDFCLSHIRPALGSNPTSASIVLPNFTKLVVCIITDNWNYFVRKLGSSSSPTAVTKMGDSNDNPDRLEEATKQSLFDLIETLFGILSLLHTEPELARHGLVALASLKGAPCQLFSRRFFVSTGMVQTLSLTILNGLSTGSLLNDDALVLLYSSLSSSNCTNSFLANTLPTFLCQTFTNNGCASTAELASLLELSRTVFGANDGSISSFIDEPTFVAGVSRLLGDLRFQLATSS